MISTAQFQKIIKEHYAEHGREMPWRRTRNPYRILVSEIMLQQTQVSRVIPFYKNFIKQFPDFEVLVAAKTSDVLRVWQGLGYNRRALALQKLAKMVIEKHKGRLPRDTESLIALPGIGKYTAGAVRAFAFNKPEVFIETNIRRVFIHFFFSDGKKPRKIVTDTALYRCIKRTVDHKDPRKWYYALMDYGAMLGESVRSGKIAENPNRRSAHYVKQSSFSGSDREARGKILRALLKKNKIYIPSLRKSISISSMRFSKIIAGLDKEGFIAHNKRGNYITLTH